MKKFSAKKILVGVITLAMTASMGTLAASASSSDLVFWNGNLADPLPSSGVSVGGVYSDGASISYDNGALVFDTSVSGGYMTADLLDADGTPLDDSNVPSYKYLLITVKSDDPADSQGAHLSIGKDSKNAQLGKSFTDWGINLTTDYKTYTIDLAGNDFAYWGKTGAPDIALNQSEATKGKIEIKAMSLSNDPNGSSASSSSSASSTASTSSSSSTSASSTAASSTSSSSSPKTGDNFPIAAVGLIVAASAVCVATASTIMKKKSK